MKARLSKLDKIILGIGSLVIVLVVVYAQFFSLTPLKSDLAMKQQQLNSEQKLLEIINQKKTETDNAEPEDTGELQKKVPVLPLQEQLILDLEKAETVSKSQIKTMSFAKGVEAAPAAVDPDAQNAGTAQDAAQTQPATTEGTENQAATGEQAAGNQVSSVPQGLKKLTVQLQVESETYEDFEKFIETLESLTRIVVVESISYSGGQEITSLETEDQPLSFSLSVSAYYMPELKDLEAQVPKIDAQAPAGKENPLSQFPSTATTRP